MRKSVTKYLLISLTGFTLAGNILRYNRDDLSPTNSDSAQEMNKLLTALFAGLIMVTLSTNTFAFGGKGHPPKAKKHHTHKHSTKAANPEKNEAPETK